MDPETEGYQQLSRMAVKIRGILATVSTPFDHTGAIYWSKFDFNLAQLQRTTLSGLVVAGQWGEGQLLSEREKVKLWQRACDRATSDHIVLASVSHAGVALAREFVSAAANAGCAGVLLEAPDTNALAPGAETGSLFFRAVADMADLPIIAAIRATGLVDRDAERLARLSVHPRIEGAVVTGCTADLTTRAVAECAQGFSLLTTQFETVAECLRAGARAAVLPVAAVVPFFALSIEEAVRTRDFDAALDLTSRAVDLNQLVCSHGVAALKQAIDLRSGYGGRPRMPLTPVSQGIASRIEAALDGLAS